MVIDRLRASARRAPTVFVAVSGALNLLIAGIAAFAIPTPINPSGGYARLYQCGLVLFNILYMGGMASWGPRR